MISSKFPYLKRKNECVKKLSDVCKKYMVYVNVLSMMKLFV